MGLNIPPSDRNIQLSDITTANSTSARHGFLPKLSNVVTEFLNGQGGFTTPAGGMASSGSAYAIVGGSAVATTNGTNLDAAYTVAKAATPHGAALSASNRYTLFLLPGVYDMGAGSLTLDTQFVDVIGLSDNTGQVLSTVGFTDQGDTIITSTTTPINVTAATQDITIGNLTLRTTTGGSDSCLSTSQAGFGADFKCFNTLLAYAGAGNRITQWDKSFNGTWTDVRAFNVTGATGSRAFGASVAGAVTISGTFVRCKADLLAWGGENNVSITLSGVFIDCESGQNSFGGSGAGGTNTLSGTFLRCRPGVSAGNMFGGTNGVLSGVFDGCQASASGSCWGATMSGTMRNCSGNTPGWTSVTGSIIGCQFSGWNGIYTMNTADSTAIANTAAETNFSLTKTINVKDWKVGKAFRWEAWGKLSNVPGAVSLTIRSKFGSTVLRSTGAVALLGSSTNLGWVASGIIVLRTSGATGTVSTQLRLELDNAVSASDTVVIPSNGTVTIDTTTANTFQLSAEWSVADAGNTITLENFVLVPEAGN